MNSSRPLAVLCSDIHLSEKPPVARSAEPDWFAAMARPLRQMGKYAQTRKLPIICAGDVFDRSQPSSVLINFALDELPVMFGVPGQHDLPYHDLTAMDKSAFGTMEKVGRIKYLPPDTPCEVAPGFMVYGFPWGCPVGGAVGGRARVNLAVIHAYVWSTTDTAHPGAAEEQSVKGFKNRLDGFDAAVFGDNHKGFLSRAGKCTVFNHGGFMRRKTDERDYKPGFGVLYSDGSVERVLFDTTKDRWMDENKAKEIEVIEGHMSDFIRELKNAGHTELDYREALNTYFRTYSVSDGAKKIILDQTNG